MGRVDREKIKKLVELSLNKVYEHDSYLIINTVKNSNDNHLCERSIVFRFAYYFQELINGEEFFKEYRDLNVDCEYNRNIDAKKQVPKFDNGTYPDLIVHKRGDNENNLLIIEFKTWWNPNIEKDTLKIAGFIDGNGDYRYNYGISIIFNRDNADVNWIS